MATNITYAPKRVNNVPNAIFNSADFAEVSADDKYLKKTGGVLSGSLTVPSLISNGGITLQSVYPSLPTQTQLGGVFKSTTTITTTDTMRAAYSTYGTISLPAGCYIILYSFELFNNASTVASPRPTLIYSNLRGGFSLVQGTWANPDSITIYSAAPFPDNNGGSFGGTTFYQHNNVTNKMGYLTLQINGNGNSTVISNITAIRVA